MVKDFGETGSVQDITPTIRVRVAHSTENIAAVHESVFHDPQILISQQLGISRTTTWRILKDELNLFPYKIQLTQELKATDHEQRRKFTDLLLAKNEIDNDFSRKFIFSDEANFNIKGYVNRQNYCIWGSENPREFQKKPIHSQRVTV